MVGGLKLETEEERFEIATCYTLFGVWWFVSDKRKGFGFAVSVGWMRVFHHSMRQGPGQQTEKGRVVLCVPSFYYMAVV
jgi:hypothetical protein